jgi:hypothetical protein
MKNNKKIIRHGDVLLRESNKIPTGTKQLRTKIVAEGEATGHNHKFQGQVLIYETEQGQKFVDAKEELQLTHQEHKTIHVPAGIYEVIQEQEFDPFQSEIQRVRD